MKRMECKLSQDIRVEARHHQRTSQDRSRIVVQTLLVQEWTKVVEVVLTTVIQPKKSKLISACAAVAKELFKQRILFIFTCSSPSLLAFGCRCQCRDIPHICLFFTQAKFSENKIYTEKRVNYDKLHSKLPILCINYDKLHSKLPILCINYDKLHSKLNRDKYEVCVETSIILASSSDKARDRERLLKTPISKE